MSKTKEPTKAKPTEANPVSDGPRWYGVWLTDGKAYGTWLRDEPGWLIHYPAEAIAAAHAELINADRHLRSGALQAEAKPF